MIVFFFGFAISIKNQSLFKNPFNHNFKEHFSIQFLYFFLWKFSLWIFGKLAHFHANFPNIIVDQWNSRKLRKFQLISRVQILAIRDVRCKSMHSDILKARIMWKDWMSGFLGKIADHTWCPLGSLFINSVLFVFHQNLMNIY